MRILVTGSSGHVGGAIAGHLAGAGHDVVGLGRSGGGGPGVAEEIVHDLGDPQAWATLDAAMPAVDAIVHAAACLDADPAAHAVTLVNCGGTQVLVSLALGRRVPLVYVSGVPVIGAPRQLPVDEHHPTVPGTAYHASKLFGEHLVGLAAASGIPAASLRLTAPVGPGLPHGRILSVFARRAVQGEPLQVAGRGTRRQDYVDVRDAARAVELALQSRASGVINIAAGVSTSNEELARRCVSLLGSDSSVTLGHVPDPLDDLIWDVSIERAAERLGWRPRFDLDAAIRAAAA